MSFQEELYAKPWVSPDEHIRPLTQEDIGEDGQEDIEDRWGNLMFKWEAPESYIPIVTLEQAMKDEDVCVGDIELKKGHIVLMDNREGNWE